MAIQPKYSPDQVLYWVNGALEVEEAVIVDLRCRKDGEWYYTVKEVVGRQARLVHKYESELDDEYYTDPAEAVYSFL